MRVSGTRCYYRPAAPKMPAGLVELMEGMTKEVLKHNPPDIYAFCANHMQSLLETRDGPIKKKELTLEEKIADVQAKMRQKAIKRRELYDKNLLLQLQEDIKFDETDTTELPDSKKAETNVTTNQIINPSEEKLSVNRPIEVSKNIQLQDNKSSESDILTTDEIVNSQGKAITHKITHPLDVNTVQHQETEGNTLHTNQLAQLAESVNVENDLITDSNTHSDIEIKTNAAMLHSELNETLLDTHNDNNDNSLVIDLKETKQTDSTSTVQDVPSSKNDLPVPTTRNADNNITNIDITLVDPVNLSGDLAALQHSQGGTSTTVKIPKELVNSMINIDKDSTDIEHKTFVLPDNEISSKEVKVSINDLQIKNESQSLVDDETGKEEDSKQNVLSGKVIEKAQGKCNENEGYNGTNIEETVDSNTNKVQVKHINHSENLTDTTTHNSDPKGSFIDVPTSDTDGDIDILITDDIVEPKNVEDWVNNKETDSVLAISHNDGLEFNASISDTNPEVELVHTSSAFSDNDAEKTEDELPSNQDENDLNNDSESSTMDLETAAVTIQKVFRTFLFKSRASTFEDSVNEDSNFIDEEDKNQGDRDFSNGVINAERRPLGMTRMDTVLQTVNEEKSLSLSTDDSSTLSSAATIIQAHVRGYLVRNRLNSNKTLSTNSLAASNSNEPSLTSIDADNDQNKNKTVLNIHIVPEGGDFLTRDESLITSVDLSLDSSPPSSINLHPLSYDKAVTERRKQLKREDAIQSVSPPSNNSGKLSEDVESVKDLSNDQVTPAELVLSKKAIELQSIEQENNKDENIIPTEGKSNEHFENNDDRNADKLTTDKLKEKRKSLSKMSSDERDVVTPSAEENNTYESKLLHSGEFHDGVLPTEVSRRDSSVVSEFKNVLIYFLLWNDS